MPRDNHFRHQIYTADAPAAPFELLRPNDIPPPGSGEFGRRMQAVGDALRAQGVAAIYLVHGTFAGCDALGILGELEPILPWLGGAGFAGGFRRTAKRLVDAVFGDTGNYTAAYAETFERGINRPGERHLPVRRLSWSGENHHLGRADAAVRLIDELACGRAPPNGDSESRRDSHTCHDPATRTAAPSRILLWGHSHAGNVFALMSNLLGSRADALDEFFTAARPYYRGRLLGRGLLPHWERVRELLTASSLSPEGRGSYPTVDFVTFGTPIRYGWDAGGYGRLLHFVNHRPTGWLPPYRAPFPPRQAELAAARDGDYIQQLGIAGTNFPPAPLAWRAVLADLRLGRLLQPGIRRRDLLDRLLNGMRVPNEGTTLLVDYGPPSGAAGPQNVVQHLAGHGVYTRPEWLLFHAEETARRLCPMPNQRG